MSKKHQFFQRLNWRMYAPADEREQDLYNKAYRLSYRFMIGMLTGGFIVFSNAQKILLPNELLIAVFLYVFGGMFLAEWIGGRVFIGQDISFSDRRIFRWFDIDERFGLAVMILFIFISTFAAATFYILTKSI